MAFSITSPTIGGGGGNGVPVCFRVSTDKDPAHKNIQMQSDYPLVYVYTTQEGGYLGTSQAPTNVFSPLVATWTFTPGLTYPTTINVDMYDAASWMLLGSQNIQLFGQDVFKVRITYTENIPAAQGYIDALINGQRMTVRGTDYIYQEFVNEDVTTRGSGN